MKVGIMGGTFDPVHLGHLVAAERALEGAELDEVWFLPANVPPHKPNQPMAEAAQRWEMVKLAVSGNPRFRAIDLELTREGVSFTVDTVAELGREYPGFSFSYIIGADMVMYLPKWHKIERILETVSFIGLRRAGIELRLDELPGPIRAGVRLVAMPLLEISSTDIRACRRSGQSIRYLTPEPVRDYIERNGLYEP